VVPDSWPALEIGSRFYLAFKNGFQGRRGRREGEHGAVDADQGVAVEAWVFGVVELAVLHRAFARPFGVHRVE